MSERLTVSGGLFSQKIAGLNGESTEPGSEHRILLGVFDRTRDKVGDSSSELQEGTEMCLVPGMPSTAE